MQSVEIPAWAWGLLTMLMAGGLTMVGTILRAYTQGVDDRLKGHDKRLAKHDVEIATLRAERR